MNNNERSSICGKILFNILLPAVVVVILCDRHFSRLSRYALEDDDELMKPRYSTLATNIVVSKELPIASHDRPLDFAIIGFPKTGTTTLSATFYAHNETYISENEFCELYHPEGEAKLKKYLQNRSKLATSARKFGIKCPSMVRGTTALEKITKSFASTRLVVGVRHPVLWFQSFYNYRVWHVHDENLTATETFPSPLELVDGNEWRDVSTEYARFDLFLKQLAKVPLSNNDLKELMTVKTRKARVSPTPFQVFIYSTEQIGDRNATRQAQFRYDLQTFLGLESPINKFEFANKLKGLYPESIDICDPEYLSLRHILIGQGQKSYRWITTQFLESNDVVVSDREYFTSLLRDWGKDPCL